MAMGLARTSNREKLDRLCQTEKLVRRFTLFALALLTFGLLQAAEDTGDQTPPLEQGCSFRTDPAEFLNAQARARDEVLARVGKLGATRTSAAAVEPRTLPRRNFIDDEIFNRLEQMRVGAAGLSTDEEFIRRIYLDLTGRLPASREVRGFVADANSNKREELIDRLLVTPEFSDKWAVWFADLIQATERLTTSARAPQIEGRNALDLYLRDALRNNKTVRRMVTELITAKGNSYYIENGQANYPVLASAAMGPAQDTYDLMLTRSTAAFLGMAHYDCLVCHNGRGHLTGISLWGESGLRVDALRMSAFFSRMRLNNGAPGAAQYEHPLFNSTDVQDAATGSYDLNTNSGNRPNRVPVGTERTLTPEYRDGTKAAANGNWRAIFADKLTADPMFARNFANRLWKQFFGLGLVDPVDVLDPARLDPRNPPPAPWTLQASHPELLEKLAKTFVDEDTNIRGLIRVLVMSTAYQLSSSYGGEWKLDYVPLFARHYPRRLDAEEVHDAVVSATGVLPKYTWPMVNGQTIPLGTAAKQSDGVIWAMQLPDVNEPRNNTAVRDFMRAFNRGNRDTAFRSQAGSIQQQLGLMNDRLVLDRIRVAASPALAAMARMTDNNDLLDELFLTFLSRKPTPYERGKAATYLTRAVTRTAAVEDLAWAVVNKTDFLFSY